MATKILSFEEMKSAIENGRLTITTGKDITKGTDPNSTIHHPVALKPQGTTGGSEIEYEKFSFILPPLVFSNITKSYPKESRYASYFMHGDIYGKWPLGKNRGEDPKGDMLLDFFTSIEEAYKTSLGKDDATRTTIVKFTKQEKMEKGVPVPLSIPEVQKMVDSIVSYPVFQEGHALAGQRDEAKSPSFKVKLWDAKITSKNQGQIRPDSLLVNGDSSDPSKYLQVIYTKVYDRRRSAMTDDYVTRESALDEFTYSAGDSSRGKPQCSLLATVTLLAPSWYWDSSKRGVCSIQFKASSIDVYKKTNLKRASTLTSDQKILRWQDALKAAEYYDIGAVEDEEEDNHQTPESSQNLSGQTVQPSASVGATPGGRMRPGETGFAPQYKTNQVAIYSDGRGEGPTKKSDSSANAKFGGDESPNEPKSPLAFGEDEGEGNLRPASPSVDAEFEDSHGVKRKASEFEAHRTEGIFKKPRIVS
jgi:hypothetical protein